LEPQQTEEASAKIRHQREGVIAPTYS